MDSLQEQYDYWAHPYTVNLPETHDVIRGWRDLFDEHQQKTGTEM